MSLLVNQPTRALDRFPTIFDDLFEMPNNWVQSWSPAVDIKESDKNYTFQCELPGVRKEDVEVVMKGDTLTIGGKREESKEESQQGYLRRERQFGSFQRSFRLDADLRPEEIDAKFADGVLTVTVPKRNLVPGKRIPIA
ncbi:MAG TPA: Hsp20/alpha crystallin family protein [Fimbriimonas sp.]|nr:Hsp20/alpha crystallin family protein [Fimbriimonas sp.]